MWRILMLILGTCALAALVRLVVRFHRFSILQRLNERHRLLSWLLAAVPVAAIGLAFYTINVTTMIIVLLHLLVIWALCDLIAWAGSRLTRRSVSRDLTGIAAIGLTVVCLGTGWYMAHHVFETRYEIATKKDLGDKRLRIALLSDAHLGITLDGAAFARELERVQAAQPDAVVIVGDFVDDDSARVDMLSACAALGRLQAPLGIYFTYGNHDDGYFRYRDFTASELRRALSDNGVVILSDAQVSLGDHALLIGRKDRTDRGRLSPEALTENIDRGKYVILLDHQPNDYAAEAAAPVDLVLSGHTHGGHLFPAGQIGLLMGANDSIYGKKTIDGVDFIVTSGISGWAIPFKTGTFSEYVIIDIVESQ